MTSNRLEFASAFMEAELHERGRILLSDDRGVCAVTGERIVDEHHIYVQLFTDEIDELEDDEPRIHVSVGAVDRAVNRLQRGLEFDEEGYLGWVETDASEVKGEKGFECPVCGEEQYPEGETYAGTSELYARHASWYYIPSHVPFLHDDCVDDFCSSLENVWEYSDVLLSEQV